MQQHCLASDDTLVHFFNDFLSLPSFAEALSYNQESGLFEVVSDATEFVSRRIRSELHKSQLLYDDSTPLARSPEADNRYTVCCLDREQGIQWVLTERFPFFLQSDCYFEYRLAKLLSQWDSNPCFQQRKSSSRQTVSSATQPSFPTQFHRENNLTCSLSQEDTSGKRGSMRMKKVSFSASGQNGLYRRPSTKSAEERRVKWSSSENVDSTNLLLEHLASTVVKQAIENAVMLVNGCSQANTCNCSNKSAEQQTNHCSHTGRFPERKARRYSAGERGKVREGKSRSEQEEKTDGEKKNEGVGRWGTDRESFLDICHHGTCCYGCRPGLDEFREFLQGMPGEKLLGLWMDIERLKATEHSERKKRCVVLMRGRYLLSSSQSCLNVELLCTLGLSTSPCWTEEKLHAVQPTLTEALLLYCGSSHLLGSNIMANMVQALYAESRAGLYFTHFCEQSGNQLWENAVNFWTDLQHFHELFYQDRLDPYTVQREAQLLYFTYLCSSARRSVGVDEEVRKEVYDQLVPAFEEVFDVVEEHILYVLLEPWTLLLSRDKESYQQVEQSMLSPLEPPSAEPQESDPWSNVPPCYHGYCLGSILRFPDELWYFMSFLQNHDASIHLACWLDLEQYRRTPQKDAALRQERSSQIATKYLNKNYFFGPSSPASEDQQSDILRLAGGMERLTLECISNPIVVEIQNIIKSYIEKTWLPLFLSTAEFSERQKDKLSKADGLWMNSSKEILLFRRVLRNPETCLLFQYFASLKGDFLENDVLFWLEVQRYKDLCHSHSDEDTIQQKISTIISCFINSSMPPSLQIDISPELALHILDRRHELGPYIFREAQLSVFSELLKLWPEFQALRSSVKEEELLPLLQEKRLKHRAKLRRQRRKEEEYEAGGRRKIQVREKKSRFF
ncbi:hypothetical protein LDENG_00119300 [Lucifuga dentata]|nr:hypothetical protein LDENG_00119300 [Lucifuga dentata]